MLKGKNYFENNFCKVRGAQIKNWALFEQGFFVETSIWCYILNENMLHDVADFHKIRRKVDKSKALSFTNKYI